MSCMWSHVVWAVISCRDLFSDFLWKIECCDHPIGDLSTQSWEPIKDSIRDMLLRVLWRPKTKDCCYLWPLECIKPNLVYPNFVHGGSVEILQIFLCVWVENNAIVVWACAWWAIIVVGFEAHVCWGILCDNHPTLELRVLRTISWGRDCCVLWITFLHVEFFVLRFYRDSSIFCLRVLPLCVKP